MNEKLQYATMLEIPVSTATVTYKPKKKKRKFFGRKVDEDKVKRELIEKVNQDQLPDLETVEQEQDQPEIVSEQTEEQSLEILEDPSTAVVKPMPKKKNKPNFKVSIIGVQLIIIGVLMATIFLTSALNVNSGINVFLRNVFGTEQGVSVDNRTYLDFTPVINDGRNHTIKDGVVTFSGEGSVYSSCDGQVTSCETGEDGKLVLTVNHSGKFCSVFTGLDYVYTSVGSEVRGNIPVGYSFGSGATMCFTGLDGSIIAGYEIIDNTVVWAV